MTEEGSWAICRVLKAGSALQKRLELCVVRHNLTGVITSLLVPTYWYGQGESKWITGSMTVCFFVFLYRYWLYSLLGEFSMVLTHKNSIRTLTETSESQTFILFKYLLTIREHFSFSRMDKCTWTDFSSTFAQSLIEIEILH